MRIGLDARIIYSAFIGFRNGVKWNGYSIGRSLLHSNVCSVCARKNTRCLVTKSNSKAFSDYSVYFEVQNTKPLTQRVELISTAEVAKYRPWITDKCFGLVAKIINEKEFNNADHWFIHIQILLCVVINAISQKP